MFLLSVSVVVRGEVDNERQTAGATAFEGVPEIQKRVVMKRTPRRTGQGEAGKVHVPPDLHIG